MSLAEIDFSWVRRIVQLFSRGKGLNSTLGDRMTASFVLQRESNKEEKD